MIMEKEKVATLVVRSIAFSHNGHIPLQYTCEGENFNPPIEISNVPRETKTLALVMEDPDAPRGVFVHWVLWDLSPHSSRAEKTNQGISGKNGFGKIGYGGPCPPSGTHRYFFKVYALDNSPQLEGGADKDALHAAIMGHIIAEGELMGLYSKKNKSNL